MTKATFKKAHKDTNNTETVAAMLTALELSTLNPRQNACTEGLDALALSIKAVGLLQNLIGIKDGETIGIVAGGRRLQALKALAANGDIPNSTSVLVRIADTEEQALQWAATENEAREDLSPADEVRAYHAMSEAGMKVADIAIANAKTVRHVKGRLRLAALSPLILDALERGDITLDAAAAFTITDNHDKQEETFQTISSYPWWRNDVQQIKSNLSSDIPDQRDIRFAIVTPELYEQRGGTVHEDLFGEQTFYPDADLLDQLASERMDEIKAELTGQGWKWADMHLARKPWDFEQAFDIISPVQPEIAEGVEERMEELEGLMNEETITEEQLQEFDELEASITPFYRDHHRAVSGVTVFINHTHELQLVEGLVREEDRTDAIANGLIEIENDEPAPKSNNPTPYSEAFAKDLAIIRTGAAQSAILADAKFARDLAIFALCFPMYAGVSPMLIDSRSAMNQVEDHGQDLTEELERYPAQHMDHKEALLAFEQFMALSDKMKTALLTETVAKSFTATLFIEGRNNYLLEDIMDRLKVNVRETWTPNSTFFNRLKNPQLDDVMAHILDRPAAQSFTKSPKRDKVFRLHALFNNEVDQRGFSDEEKQRIANWSPDCLKGATEHDDDKESDQADCACPMAKAA